MNHNNSNVLALDVGERRIGVAMTSWVARMPSPLETIDTQKTPEFEKYIAKLVQDNDVSPVIVGLPRGLNGQETLQTKHIREVAKKIESALDVPVIMQDEAGTSVEAEKRLKQRGKPYDRGAIDAEAAAIILEDYLKNSGGIV